MAIRDGAHLVWNDGFSVACEAGSSPIEMARIVRTFIKSWWAQYQPFVWLNPTVAFRVAPLGIRRQAKMHNNEPTMLRSGPQK